MFFKLADTVGKRTITDLYYSVSLLPAGASPPVFSLSLTLEFDALRQTLGHGKQTCKFRFMSYRVLLAAGTARPCPIRHHRT